MGMYFSFAGGLLFGIVPMGILAFLVVSTQMTNRTNLLWYVLEILIAAFMHTHWGIFQSGTTG